MDCDLFGKPVSAGSGPPPTAADTNAAKRLREIVNAAEGRSSRPFRPSSWAREFRLLREELTNGAERITAALEWYAAHVGKKYVPDARCASSFRAKFGRIEAAMQRGDPVPKRVVLSPTAERIVAAATNQPWPAGAEERLPAVVQESVDALDSFLARVAAMKKELERVPREDRNRFDQSHVRLCAVILANVDADDYLRHWFVRAQRDVAGWEEWSGKVERFAWRIDHKWATAAGRGWADEATGSGDGWAAFLSRLGVS